MKPEAAGIPERAVAPEEGPNLRLARAALEGLMASGVRALCLCPGGRNAPLIAVLDHAAEAAGLAVYPFFEERSAAFFALGRAAATERPVAVLTTSGTAVAELLPAVIEARYRGVPLIALSADRPASFRGSGAPQAIEQVGLFGAYAPTLELTKPEQCSDLAAFVRAARGPAHLNLPFDEPLIDGAPRHLDPPSPTPALRPEAAEGAARLREAVAGWRRPLAVLGPLPSSARAPVARWLEAYRPLIYAEGPSGLREHPRLAPLCLRAGDGLLRPDGPLFSGSAAIDGVLRIGGVPTTRLVRDLAGSLRALPHLAVTAGPYAGVPGGARIEGDLAALFGEAPPPAVPEGAFADLLALDARLAAELEALLEAHPRSEPALVRAFSLALGPSDALYVGNSMPIRLWDLAAGRAAPRPVACSRGANGIDGQLSAFLGGAGADHGSASHRAYGLFGDLTALYDLAAPWALAHLEGAEARFAILNNGGGGIFGRMFQSPTFKNAHGLGFEGWARMWGLRHARLRSLSSLPEAEVLEILPEEAETEAFFAAYDAACAGLLARRAPSPSARRRP